MPAPPKPKPDFRSPPTSTVDTILAVSSPHPIKLLRFDYSATKLFPSGTTPSSHNCKVVLALSLNGRQGSFTFSHRATMMKGDAPSAGELSVMVVPNSGTGELTGLTGSLMIPIDAQGKHTWTFDYSLP